MALENTPQEACRIVLHTLMRYAQSGRNLATAALAGSRQFELMRHYPANDLVDRDRGLRFFYHAHRQGEQEHGHFHLFAQVKGGEWGHLVALSLDTQGMPLQWFTTNRWVTGGDWLDAHHALGFLRGFEVSTYGRMAPVSRFLSGMLVLFAEELDSLFVSRDEALVAHESRLGPTVLREALFEDRTIDILSQVPAALAPKVAQLESSALLSQP